DRRGAWRHPHRREHTGRQAGRIPRRALRRHLAGRRVSGAKVRNRHGTALVLADRGVLITGPSGSGKTTLAFALLAHCRSLGVFARLISDDQVYLAAGHGRLITTAPDTIAGMMEAFGAGPAPISHESCAVIDLLVELVDPKAAPRLCDSMEE